jgi:hypothetical protein
MGDSKSQKMKVIGGQSVMRAQAVQELAAALVGVGSCSPSFLLSTAHPQQGRRGGWEKEEERGRDKPKGGLWILSPFQYMSPKSRDD